MHESTASLRIRSDPGELAAVRDRVREAALSAGFDEQDAAKIVLAVDEALSNVIRHGYGGPCDSPIEIRLSYPRGETGTAIRLAIRDFGRQTDPSRLAGRDLEEVRPGGMGISIIRSVMDEVDYRPVPGGGMELTMVKRSQT